MNEITALMTTFTMILLLASMPVLAQECTPGLSVDTDQDTYLRGDAVIVTGQILDQSCDPVTVMNDIGITVVRPLGAGPLVVNQTGTNDNGEFTFSFKLPLDARLGEYMVWSSLSYSGLWDTEPFWVTGGECIDDETQQCGSTGVGACKLGTETCSNGVWGSCTGAVGPVSEVCDDSIDNDCDGSTDEDCSSGGGGSSSSSSCTPNWQCSEWEECQPDDTQIRNCTDIRLCNKDTGKPVESQACTFEGGSGSDCEELWSCGDWSACTDNEQSRECRDLNECGTEESIPAESQACTADAGPGPDSEGGPPTGLVIGEIVTAYWWMILIVFMVLGYGAYRMRRSSGA